MHTYLPHILSDIAAAGPREPLEFYETLLQTNAVIFGSLCGLKPMDFPPASQLSKHDMQRIIHAYRKMMRKWKHSVELPGRFPVTMVYQVILDSLDCEITSLTDGNCCYTFCQYYPYTCRYKQYCPCLEFWENEEEEDEDE